MEVLKTLWPVLAIQAAFSLVAVVDILIQKKTRNLSVPIWILIVLFVNIFGPILYFTLGRNED